MSDSALIRVSGNHLSLTPYGVISWGSGTDLVPASRGDRREGRADRMREVPSQRSAMMSTPRGGRLTRPLLVRRVEQAESPFLLLVAPSGFGKTNLLSEWSRASSSDVAWLTCVDADQDPSHFWLRLTAALRDR